MIAANLKSVTLRMANSCERSGRPTGNVKLVCVTKESSIDEVQQVLAEGVKDLGENRVQELILKSQALGPMPNWHLIGHLQTNKVKDAVRVASLIHSVDSVKLAEEIDKQAERLDKIQDILVQVNISGEKSKFGIEPSAVSSFFKSLAVYDNINIRGLMGMAPEVPDQEDARPYFHKLRSIFDELNCNGSAINKLDILSMGMSNDFEVAIEEGSTLVRIGRAIFKK